MKRLPIPDDWAGGGDGYYVALFCFPKSLQWKAIILGLFHTLTWGYTWDEKTGTIIDVKETSISITETICIMDCDDLVTNLERVAVALESIDNKTPSLVDLQDIFDNPENYFAAEIIATIAPLMEIGAALSSFFPTIKVDPFNVVKWVTGMIRHTQILGALAAIAGAIMAGVAGQGTQTLISLITGAFDYLMDQQAGLQAIRDWLSGGASSWFKKPVQEVEDNYSGTDYSFWWHNQNVILGDIADSLRHMNEISQDCQQANCLCLSEGGGVVAAPIFDIECYTPPIPFTWDGYEQYRKNFLYMLHTTVNAYFSLFGNAFNLAANYAKQWRDELDDLGGEASQGDILRSFGNEFPQLIEQTMSNYWLGNQTQNDKAERLTGWTNYLIELLSTILSTDSDTDVESKTEIYFTDVFVSLIDEYTSDAASIFTTINEYFDSDSALNSWQTAIVTTLNATTIDTTITAAAYNELTSLVENAFNGWVFAGLYQPVDGIASIPSPAGFITSGLDCGA